MVGQILDWGLEAFLDFAATVRRFMANALSILHADTPCTGPVLEELFRNLHTIKGNARMAGFSYLVDAVHQSEEAYAGLRSQPDLSPDRELLAGGVHSVLGALQSYEDICARKLGDIGRRNDGHQADAALGAIGELLAAQIAGRIDPGGFARAVDETLARAGAVCLRDVVRDCSRMLPSLALELGKSAPLVVRDDETTQLSTAWAQTLKDVLVHAFRNSLDHGIEPADERRRNDKPERGRITVYVDRSRGGTTINLSDDGRGIPLGALRERIGNSAGNDDEIAEKAFQSGISSAARVSSVSGRGVGLNAIRSFVREQGGEARIRLTGPGQRECRPFEIIIEPPTAAVVLDARARTA